MEALFQDLRYALRQLAKSPLFTIVAIGTLAVGLGANTAVFSVLYRAVLRTLPVRDAGHLVHVVTDRGPDGVNYNLSYPRFEALRTGGDAFSGVAAHTSLALALGSPEGARRVEGAAVSRGFFAVIGAPLARGRDFLPEEDTRGGPAAVVLSYPLWQQAFGGRDDVVGDRVTLNGQPFTVVGVAAPSFTGLIAGRAQQLWIPLGALTRVGSLGEYLTAPTASWLDVFARLAPGTSLARAQAQVALLDAGAVQQGTFPASSHTQLLPGEHGLTFVVSGVTKPLVLLLLVVALVLLLTCANVANLLLARAGARRREIAIRLATGASRSRLVRQLMTESLLLAGLGGLAGLLVARWGVDFLLAYQPAGGSLDVERGLDPFVMSAAVALTLLTGLAFGLAPAWRATRADVVPALKGGEPRTVERMFGWRGALVVFQVAISLVLVVGAALFLRSMRNLRAVDIGFTPGPVLLAAVDLEQGGYDRSRGATFLTQLLDRLAAAPGVEIATAAEVITPNPGGSNWSGVALEGFTPAAGEDVSFDVNKVGPRYFEAMGIALVRGRGFTTSDRDGAPRVAVVNESFARRYYPGADPVGRHIRLGAGCRGGRHRDRRHRPRREIPRRPRDRVRRPSISPCSRATRHRSRWCCGRAVTRSRFPVQCDGRSARWTPGSRCSTCVRWRPISPVPPRRTG